jgi:hypothetical protein
MVDKITFNLQKAKAAGMCVRPSQTVKAKK